MAALELRIAFKKPTLTVLRLGVWVWLCVVILPSFDCRLPLRDGAGGERGRILAGLGSMPFAHHDALLETFVEVFPCKSDISNGE